MWLEVNKLLLPIAESQRQYVVSDIIHVCNSQHKSHFKGSSFSICSPRCAFSLKESIAFSLRSIHSFTLAITLAGACPSTTLPIALFYVWNEIMNMLCFAYLNVGREVFIRLCPFYSVFIKVSLGVYLG